MAHFLLVHGAWHGGWCWAPVASILERRGHTVDAPDLPGHGEDTTALADLDLDRYAGAVAARLRAAPGPVQLVGHSLAGLVITAAAERIPEAVARLVFLAAFVPLDGDSVRTLGAFNGASWLTGSRLEPVQDGVGLRVRDDARLPAFYHDCREADVEFAQARLVDEAARVFAEPCPVRAGAHLPRAYVACEEDQAVHLAGQRAMARRGGCDPVVTLPTGHSPFFSAPGLLADALEAVAVARS